MTLAQIHSGAEAHPDKTALIYNDRPLSYRRFAGAIDAPRRVLAGADLPAEGVAIVLAPSLLAAWLLVLSARSMGLTTVVAQSVQAARDLGLRNVAAVLRQSHGLEAFGGGAFEGAAEAFPGARIVDPPAEVLAAEAPAPGARLAWDGRWGDHILYSSGTTGAYKKVLVEGASETARSAERVRVSGFDGDTVFHALNFGLWTGIGLKTPSAAWLAGGAVIIDQTPDAPAKFLRHGPTYAQTTPESLRPIIDAHAPDHPPSERLLLRCGGGFVPLSLAQAATQRIARRLVVGFSSTEMAAAMMQSPFETPDDLQWLRPDAQRVIQVADDDDAECPPGVEGALRIKVTEVDSHGYLDDPETTARVFRGGFFYPGDLAVKREDGRIRILGRTADVINIGGRKVAVGPIEQTLQRALGVDEVCLFGGQGADGVEEVVVAVQTRLPLTPEEIVARLGPSKIFGRVRVAVFEAFPRTETGLAKTRRTELRRMVFGGAS